MLHQLYPAQPMFMFAFPFRVIAFFSPGCTNIFYLLSIPKRGWINPLANPSCLRTYVRVDPRGIRIRVAAYVYVRTFVLCVHGTLLRGGNI